MVGFLTYYQARAIDSYVSEISQLCDCENTDLHRLQMLMRQVNESCTPLLSKCYIKKASVDISQCKLKKQVREAKKTLQNAEELVTTRKHDDRLGGVKILAYLLKGHLEKATPSSEDIVTTSHALQERIRSLQVEARRLNYTKTDFSQLSIPFDAESHPRKAGSDLSQYTIHQFMGSNNSNYAKSLAERYDRNRVREVIASVKSQCENKRKLLSLMDRRRINHKLRQLQSGFYEDQLSLQKNKAEELQRFTEECLRHSSRRYCDYSQNVGDDLRELRRQGCVLIADSAVALFRFSHTLNQCKKRRIERCAACLEDAMKSSSGVIRKYARQLQYFLDDIKPGQEGGGT